MFKVPFWIRGPNITAQQKVTTPVLSIDIAPTILELAGIPYSPLMDGLSFTSLVVSNSTEDNITKVENSVDITHNEIPTEKEEKVRDVKINSSSPIITNYTGIQVVSLLCPYEIYPYCRVDMTFLWNTMGRVLSTLVVLTARRS